jgi:hypothetical protein
MPPEPLDAAIIFATVGDLVPLALKAVRKGGRVVCAGIHMSDIPSFPYHLLWEERQLVSVANLTRQDGIDFLRLAPEFGIVTTYHALSAQPRPIKPSPISAPGDSRARRFSCHERVQTCVRKRLRSQHGEVPVIALANTHALDVVWHPRIGDTRTMERRAIERWENEGGEIPNEQRKRTRFLEGKSSCPSAFHYFSKAIIK